MVKQIENEVAYYYDSHPTEEDLMGETSDHATLVSYLMAVLKWLFHGQRCAIYENLNFYQTGNKYEHPLAPDIAAIKEVSFQRVKSWRIGTTGPAPHVVFEIASEETWTKDLNEKVWKYARMGVQEYYAYDPNDPPVWRGVSGRLIGWKLDEETQVMRKLPVDPGGRLWSFYLNSFLVPDGQYLRLYDRYGQMRVTKDEAETVRAEAEARKSQAFAEKLRSLGIDPDQIL
jgi:Uma2 family endonuclease